MFHLTNVDRIPYQRQMVLQPPLLGLHQVHLDPQRDMVFLRSYLGVLIQFATSGEQDSSTIRLNQETTSSSVWWLWEKDGITGITNTLVIGLPQRMIGG